MQPSAPHADASTGGKAGFHAMRCIFKSYAAKRQAITLRDLNSLNGTYVNGKRVEETPLRSADEVQIGKFKLVFWEATR